MMQHAEITKNVGGASADGQEDRRQRRKSPKTHSNTNNERQRDETNDDDKNSNNVHFFAENVNQAPLWLFGLADVDV